MTTTDTPAVAVPMLGAAVEAFLFREARLIDQGHLDEWFALWSRAGLYWAPMDDDPRRGLSLFYEDWTRLRDRLTIMKSETAYPQEPRSQTVRSVTNVEFRLDPDGLVETNSALHIVERRRGQQWIHAGRVEHRLEITDDAASPYRIRTKVVRLLGATDALGNISFLL